MQESIFNPFSPNFLEHNTQVILNETVLCKLGYCKSRKYWDKAFLWYNAFMATTAHLDEKNIFRTNWIGTLYIKRFNLCMYWWSLCVTGVWTSTTYTTLNITKFKFDLHSYLSTITLYQVIVFLEFRRKLNFKTILLFHNHNCQVYSTLNIILLCFSVALKSVHSNRFQGQYLPKIFFSPQGSALPFVQFSCRYSKV